MCVFQVQEEGTAEAETYDKFACFCKDKDGAKVESIATREADITTLTADLEQLDALRVDKEAETAATREQQILGETGRSATSSMSPATSSRRLACGGRSPRSSRCHW